MERMRRRILIGTCVASLLSLASASAAGAGRYHVYSCRTPSGGSAPTDGWSGSVEGAYDNYAKDTCATGGALVAGLPDTTTHMATLDKATWTLSVPPEEKMAGATLWRAGDADGGEAVNATYEFWLAGTTESEAFNSCLYQFGCLTGLGDPGQPLSGTNRVVVPNANLGSRLYANAYCEGTSTYPCQDGKGDANGYAAAVYLYAADIVLEQGEGPSASNVGGELASAATVSGTSDLTFNASDPGAGVWEASFGVDGKVVQSTVPDEAGGRCRNVGQTMDGLAAFLYLQPCPRAESVDVPFDTAAVSNGAHHLVVSVIDAAGNSAPVLDREIDVSNPIPGGPSPAHPPNGTNASDRATLTARWASTKKAHLTGGWGERETITGSLTAPGNVPIAGAAIDLIATPEYTGAKPLRMASPRTGADGRFTVSLPRGVSSRALSFAYRAQLGDAQPVATRRLALSVRAGVRLSVAPRVSSVGRSIFFKGVLEGGPLPVGGKQLVLEARSPGRAWIEFDVIRSGTDGRYRASYRFKFPGPERYQFRVLSKHEADFPFAEAASNVVGVSER
jgi:hypothetical protein